jgi:hypothetical protein
MAFDYLTVESFLINNTNPNGLMVPDSVPWISAIGFSTDNNCTGPWRSDEFKYYYICYDNRAESIGWFVVPYDIFHCANFCLINNIYERFDNKEDAFNDGKNIFIY